MSGIAGILDLRGGPAPADDVRALSFGIRHRGPDGEGLHEDRRGGMVLAHRLRAQEPGNRRTGWPLPNEDRTVWLSLDGAIWNHAELREDLQARGHRFGSDEEGEAILHLWEEEGPRSVERLRGAFAIALWDSKSRTLFLARDRMGERPLHYVLAPERLAFASAIEPLASLPWVPREIDLAAIDEYLAMGFVPAPRTIWAAVRKLPAGSRAVAREGELRIERYWDVPYEPKWSLGEADAADGFRGRLDDAVGARLRPGEDASVLLDGDLPSAAVAASLARRREGKFRILALACEGVPPGALRPARAVAERFGFPHREIVVRPDPQVLLPRIVRRTGEPLAIPDAVPWFHLTGEDADATTILWSGLGGEEALACAERHRDLRLGRHWGRIPRALRRSALLPLLERMPGIGGPDGLPERLRRFARRAELSGGGDSPGEAWIAWAGIWTATERAGIYSREMAHELEGAPGADRLTELLRSARAGAPLDRFLSMEVRSMLPDGRCAGGDAAFAVQGIEVRSPFSDHRLQEWTARLPVQQKGAGLLRRAYEGSLPDEILRRGSGGTAFPLAHWLRGAMRDLARDLLLSQEARSRGLFRTSEVRRLLDEHAAGAADHARALWALVVLEAWNRIYVDRKESL